MNASPESKKSTKSIFKVKLSLIVSSKSVKLFELPLPSPKAISIF